MPGKPKSDWSIKNDELKALLPKGFDARNFRSCKGNKAEIAKMCKEKNFADKADAIYNFLENIKIKPTSKKRGAKKAKDDAQENGKGDLKLLAKSTYKGLAYDDFGKLISMLTKMQEKCIDQELAKAEANKEKEDKRIKDLNAKKAGLGKK